MASRIVHVRSAAQLAYALRDPLPGDAIELADGVYSGHFVIDRSGTSSAPITLCGTRHAILDGGGVTTGYGVALRANYWTLTGFTVRNSLKGIMTDRASFDLLSGLEVYNIGDEAIHLRTFSTHNTVQNNVIHDTGLYAPQFGEGVYIGSAYENWPTYTGGLPDKSDFNQVVGNTISLTAAESVDIKEGTTGGEVRDNTFSGVGMVVVNGSDSWVDVKGNGYLIRGNRGTTAPLDGFQTHIKLAGWGNDNAFQGNVADVEAAGYGFRIKAGSSGNVVACDNLVRNAANGFTNIPCGYPPRFSIWMIVFMVPLLATAFFLRGRRKRVAR